VGAESRAYAADNRPLKALAAISLALTGLNNFKVQETALDRGYVRPNVESAE
jgi:hypothetical protein